MALEWKIIIECVCVWEVDYRRFYFWGNLLAGKLGQVIAATACKLPSNQSWHPKKLTVKGYLFTFSWLRGGTGFDKRGHSLGMTFRILAHRLRRHSDWSWRWWWKGASKSVFHGWHVWWCEVFDGWKRISMLIDVTPQKKSKFLWQSTIWRTLIRSSLMLKTNMVHSDSKNKGLLIFKFSCLGSKYEL